MYSVENSFLILDKVDSTNNYAMGLIHAGKGEHGLVCFALDQTEGRGRRGKVWETQKGENIILTIIANTAFLRIYQQYYLSAAVAVGCYEFLKSYIPGNIKIKWPNDLFINDRKAGGILIENAIHNSLWQWAAIGIGININQTFFLIENNKKTSLKNETGSTYNVIELGRELSKHILSRINKLKNEGAEILMAEYNGLLYKLNEKIKLKKQNIVFDAIITGVSDEGKLITFDIMENRYDLDEVEWVL